MAEPVQTDKEQRRLIRMAETISKALPYMRRHNDATFVVKYGGHAMTDPKLGDLVARWARINWNMRAGVLRSAFRSPGAARTLLECLLRSSTLNRQHNRTR